MMATFTDVNAFANNVANYGHRVKGASRIGVEAAMEVAVIAIRQSGSKYRIKGRSGGRFALGAKKEGPYPYAGDWIGYVKADPAGFWALIEEGAKPHVIRPRSVTRRAARGGATARKALQVPGYGYFAKVNHPGTGPIGHPWHIGVAKAQIAAPKAYEQAVVGFAFGRAA